MGIARGMIKLLMREGKREGYSGHLLTIGRQEIWETTVQDLQRWAREMDFQLKPVTKSFPSDKRFMRGGYITDNALFLSLGFNNIDSLDYSDFEQCTITHDLNTDVPAKLHNKYDLIVDAGTSEHVFNLPKVLENYNKMLKVGGRIILSLPSSNFVDHGFYMFSPTLFWDYYSANQWEIKDSLLIRGSRRINEDPWEIYNYSPGCLDKVSFGGLNNGVYGVVFIVKKTDKSISNASVQQGLYLEKWKTSLNTKDIKPKKNNPIKKIITAVIPKRVRMLRYYLIDYILSKIPLSFRLKNIGKY